MPGSHKTVIIKTCPHCSDTNLSILRPSVERYCGRRTQNTPLRGKILEGLPVEITVKCKQCRASSTWHLIQTDQQTCTIDYTEQA